MLPRSLLTEQIRANYDILNWSLTKDDWTKINNIEPQIQLVDSTHASIDHNQLQSVVEFDDSIDESGYESEDESGYDGPEIESEYIEDIENFQNKYEIKNDRSPNIVICFRETHEGNNVVNVEFQSQDRNEKNIEIENDKNTNIDNNENEKNSKDSLF